MKKQNKGITLVALVITIIVLIILAGVSINAVMSDGIIGNSKIAKNEWEEGQERENKEITKAEQMVIDLEVEEDFTTTITQGQEKLNNGDNTINADDVVEYTNYKLRNGYLTGVNELYVSQVEQKLPVGYYIYDADGEIIGNKANTYIGTGMVIKKGETEEKAKETKQLGRVIIFGDVDGIDHINSTDAGDSSAFLTQDRDKKQIDKEYEQIAIDVNHDNIIDYKDAQYINAYWTGGPVVNQDVYAPEHSFLEMRDMYWVESNYLAGIKVYTYSDGTGSARIFSGIKKGDDVSTVFGNLPEGTLLFKKAESGPQRTPVETGKIESGTYFIAIMSDHTGAEQRYYVGKFIIE